MKKCNQCCECISLGTFESGSQVGECRRHKIGIRTLNSDPPRHALRRLKSLVQCHLLADVLIPQPRLQRNNGLNCVTALRSLEAHPQLLKRGVRRNGSAVWHISGQLFQHCLFINWRKCNRQKSILWSLRDLGRVCQPLLLNSAHPSAWSRVCKDKALRCGSLLDLEINRCEDARSLNELLGLSCGPSIPKRHRAVLRDFAVSYGFL